MAKTPVTLKVKDLVEREVLSVNYNFNRTVDREGQCTGIPRGGYVDITVKALNDGNDELLQWMLDPTTSHDTEIVFENSIDGKTMKTIKCTGCYCIKYDEKWEDKEQHQEHILISCQNIENGSAKYENAWA